jgi:hypothetical protein
LAPISVIVSVYPSSTLPGRTRFDPN